MIGLHTEWDCWCNRKNPSLEAQAKRSSKAKGKGQCRSCVDGVSGALFANMVLGYREVFESVLLGSLETSEWRGVLLKLMLPDVITD